MESQDINVESPGLFDGTIIPNSDVVRTATITNESDEETDDIISVHMDIVKPLAHLRALIENMVATKLSNYTFWLQNNQEVSLNVTSFKKEPEVNFPLLSV